MELEVEAMEAKTLLRLEERPKGSETLYVWDSAPRGTKSVTSYTHTPIFYKNILNNIKSSSTQNSSIDDI